MYGKSRRGNNSTILNKNIENIIAVENLCKLLFISLRRIEKREIIEKLPSIEK
jgi:hypothetical protein